MASPIAAVIERPTSRLTNTARMMRDDRSASHRMVSTTTMVAAVLTNAPSFRVAYSSSAIATGPVSRSFAPILRVEVQRRPPPCEWQSVAAFPGMSEL